MYKTYAFLTGIVISIMLLSNAIMTRTVGNFTGILLIHIIGFMGSIVLFLASRAKIASLKGIALIYLFGGTTGYMTVYFSNLAFITLGATLTLMLSMFGQIATSTIVDHYGILGMEKFPFKKEKFIGLTLMLIGVALIVLG